uniref:Iminophenyl-pyruvate dimer synthase domain-containing protein n=1 Tax=Ciona savignyi TaxID=51511 RepID=H2Z907_CIOSA
MFMNSLRSSTIISKAKTECNIDIVKSTFNSALRVYSSLPASVMRKSCPSWVDDIRPIFQYYFNLFPVMQRHNIINLRDYNDVKTKLHRINMSMFEYDWDHPHYMPVTRDLSPDKKEVIRRWLECEMNGKAEKKRPERPINLVRESICGTATNLQNTIKDLQNIIQMSMWLELYTIPPYITAMLSLKRELWQEVYYLLKSVATEEMLHMVLNANVLNSIGGKPNLTDAFWLPNYPTPFPSKDFYQIHPGLTLTLEKFSLSHLRDVFSEIEKPASPTVQRVFLQLSRI